MNNSKKNIFITSALPYVNNIPHLGNIIGCVLSGDVWARFCKAIGHNVKYICGTDEYGTATETKAREEGLTEQEICDKYNAIHQDVYKWFNINFDYFGRTTTDKQTEIAQQIFKDIVENDYLLEKESIQYFCPKLNTFLADRFIKGTCPYCKSLNANGDQCDDCGKLIDSIELINPYCKSNPEFEIEKRSTNHLYLDLPKLQDKLKKWYLNNNEGWSKSAKGITESWLNLELQPRCITRDLKWGTPVPNTKKYGDKYKDKVFYVWFDAPIGYISISANGLKEKWKKWWFKQEDFEVESVEFMAKDNVPFHSIIFPATLMATNKNYKLVDKIASVEYLNYEDKKFSKSKGIGVFGDNVQESGIDVDVWRYYLLYIRPESNDSQFTWDDLKEKNNSEIVNNIGNLINRVLTFSYKKIGTEFNLDNKIELNTELLNEINQITKEYLDNMEDIRLREGLKSANQIAKIGNKYMQETEPWLTFKTDINKCKTDLFILLHLVQHLSTLLNPFMPNFTQKIENMIGVDCQKINDEFKLRFEKFILKKPKIIFERISDEKIDNLKNKFK